MSFLRDPEQHAAEQLLRSYGKFLRNFKENLKTEISAKTSHNNKIIGLKYGDRTENISMFELLDSDNKVLSKILLVFFHLQKEATKLNEGAKEIIEKLMIIQDEIESSDNSELSQEEATQNVIVRFSFALEDLLNMKFLIQNTIFLSVNVIHQLSALFSYEKFFCITPSSFFPSNLDDVANLLHYLMVLDNIFRNSDFMTYLQLYGELISAQNDQMEEEMLRSLQSSLHELHLLLDGNIFQLAIDNLKALKTKIKPKALKRLENFILIHLKNLINSINFYDGTTSKLSETNEVVKLNILIVLYHQLFENLDPKSLRLATEINNKFCAIVVFNQVWNGNEILRENVPTLFKSSLDIPKQQQQFLALKVQQLEKDATVNFALLSSQWILQMHNESKLGGESINERALKLRCEIFYQGLAIAGQISHTIKTVIYLHVKLGKVMSKSLLTIIFKLVEYLRVIKVTVENHSKFIVNTIGFVFQYLQFHSLHLIGSCRRKILVEGKKEKIFDLSSVLVIVEKLLYGTVSTDRINAIFLALNMSEPVKSFGSDQLQRLVQLLDHLMTLCQLQANIEKVCEPSFLFWHQNLITAYFKQIFDSSLNTQNMKLILETANECLKDLNNLHIENVQGFHPSILRDFESAVIKRLCNSIEINLRLDFHSHIQVDRFNPFETTNNVVIEDFRSIVNLQPIIVNNQIMSIQDHVEHYLSKMFYNLTTISLKDWRTYGEIRILAERKYSLETVDDQLPTQTLDHGIDVIDIMKNIHIFVARYNYNLNNQVFVEINNNSQHLNTVSIKNIANSMRTHGTGIVNTAVNYVYQFLRKKIFTFSQFLFDEQVKSRLIKEVKYHRENSADNLYSYDRANQMNRDIKKLAVSDKGESYFDQFRKLISQIGNSMGYVRMLRSGMNHVGSQASVYLPCLDEELEFVKVCEEDKLSATTLKAAEHLEDEIRHLMKNYEEGMLFFKVSKLTFIGI